MQISQDWEKGMITPKNVASFALSTNYIQFNFVFSISQLSFYHVMHHIMLYYIILYYILLYYSILYYIIIYYIILYYIILYTSKYTGSF